MTRIQTRKALNAVALSLSALMTAISLAILAWILWVLVQKGWPALDAAFFTKLPAPPGVPGGGVANALVGTAFLTVLATVVAVPLGLLAGIHLSEYGQESPIAGPARVFANIFLSAPSIVVGVFVYAILVVPLKGFSGLAGALALAIIMLPVVTRTADEVLKLVPSELREAAMALGAPRWHVIVHVVLRGARSGLTTGCLLAVARVAGETAPLLFTCLNSPYRPSGLMDPMPNLTVTLFNYAMSPYADWQAQAWGAALLLTLAVLLTNIGARILVRGRPQ